MLKKLFKIFLLPTPHELGYADKNNALPVFVSSNTEEITWGEFDEEMKVKYPIKWFFNKSIPHFFSNYKWCIGNIIYWLKCHLLSSYKYHQLDLRQYHELSPYKFGWIDVDTKMVYAIFNLLNLFVEQELKHFVCPPENQVGNAFQRNLYFEIKYLHYWWNVERINQIRKRNEMSNNLHWDDDAGNSINYKKLREFEATMELKEEEMLLRVIKIRKHLWS